MDVEKICRLCSKEKGRLRSLFEQRPEYPLSLPQIISVVTRLEVDPEDRMPQKACSWCIKTLLKMHETIESYRTSDSKLREQLGLLTELIEIKQEEEEIDVEFLEKALTCDLEVDGICVKQEPESEDLDLDLDRESEVTDKIDESVVTNTNSSETETETETGMNEENDEWKPAKQDTKVEKVQKVRRKRLTGQEKDTNGKRKIGRPRVNFVDPNRPRLHDHKCYICKSESHGSAEALIAHLHSSHEDLLPFTCPECFVETVVIKTVQRLNAHKRQHLNPFECPQCDRRFTCKNNVKFHVETYHKNHCPSTCEFCSKVFPTKASLLHHMKLHTTAVSCEICGKVFKERQKLRLHIQSRHEKLKTHECNICQKKLGSLDSIKIHVKTYHSNQVFKCSYCPRTFTAEPTHRLHEKKHVDNPDYIATRNWSEYYTVVEGEDIHGSKMKKCNLCGIILGTTMSSHLSLEHFPTEYRCHICDATFKRKQSFVSHVAKHDNIKQYQCPICNRKFSDRKLLISHLRTKQHQDHPLAQSLDWLGLKTTQARPKKQKEANVDTKDDSQPSAAADIIVEDLGMDLAMDDSV